MNETTKPEIYKGLVGVYADVSAVSKVMPETNSLTYRGYAVQDLAENCSFEEVAYLLWEGELPNAKQLAAFKAETAAEREISPALHRVIQEFPKDAHPMDAIRTAVSFMGLSAGAVSQGEAAFCQDPNGDCGGLSRFPRPAGGGAEPRA